MEFELNKQQKDIQQAAREFARGEFDRDLARQLDNDHEYPTKIWEKACAEGFIGLHYPEKYGGSDYGCVENEIGRAHV